MIKKSICTLTALILCLGVFFSVPFTVSAVTMTQLQQTVESVPPKEDWYKYTDTSALEQALEKADECLADTQGKYSQDEVDDITQELSDAISALKKHTLALTLDKTVMSLSIGSSGTLNALTTPGDAADAITWKSSSPAVQLTKCNGTYCAFSVMSYSAVPVTITAKSNGLSASCRINVLNPFKSVTVTIEPASAYRTKTAKATAKAFGSDGNPTTDEVSWEWISSNPSIAKIGATSGKIECLSVGECIITAKGTCGSRVYSGSCKFYVNEFTPVSYITPIKTEIRDKFSLVEGETFSYSVRVSDEATIKELSWGSSDKAVMKVVSTTLDGSIATAVIKGLKTGSATLTIKATDGSDVTKRVTVTVQPKIKSLTLTNSVLVINPGKSSSPGITISPTNAGNQNLDWSSSNESVATVDYKGIISAHSVGVCNITAKTKDGSNLSVVCCVRVANSSASIIISKKSLSMKAGATSSVNATVTTIDGKSYSTKNEVNWKSSDKSIVTVSDSGKITAVKSGSAVITATAKDNDLVKATLKVTVVTSVTGIKLNKSSVNLAVGASMTIIPTVSPDDASNKAVTWGSSNTKVVTVTTTGKITAKGMGTATVSCKTADGGYIAKCTVNVITPVTSITVSPSELKVNAGSSKKISITVLPKGATDKTVTYKSSNTNIATVSSTGIVTGVKSGSAVITIASNDGHCSAQCLVTVLQKVTGIIVASEKTCYVGQVCSLDAKIQPADASNKKLIYSSSNTAVATITEAGYITAKKKGKTAITVKSDDGGYTKTCILTVTSKVSVTAFKFDETGKALKTGEKFTLVPLFSPSDASEKGVKYKSSNSLVATVSSAGIVTAKGPGSCTITGTTIDGGFTSTCKVIVKQPVTGVSFALESVIVAAGKKLTATPNIAPSNASNKSLKWKSSDTKIAKISSNGVITGVKPGTCKVTCTTVDGGFKAELIVVVYQAVTGIKLARTKAELAKGKSVMMTVHFTPSDATNQGVIWTTSNKSVASVNANGKVTAKSPGTCTITCKSSDGGFTATCKVTVFRPVTGVSLNYSSVRLDAGKTKTLKVTILPENATYKSVTWNSSDSNVADVDEKGILHTYHAGTARISAVSKDGYCSAYCTVTVVQAPKKVSITAKSTQLNIGCATQLKATVSPADSYNKNVIWLSSDTATAMVNADGVVTAIKAGKVTITCRAVAGGASDEIEIQCKIPPESMSMRVKTATVLLGKSTTLRVSFTPADTTIKTVKWSSSNPSVVKVDKNGKVTALAIGSATITAKSTDGGITDTCFITVPRRTTGLKLNKTSITVEKGASKTVEATVLPLDATYDTVTWKSADKNIATVNSDGRVTGRAVGTTTITATSRDGGFSKKCTVKVIIAPANLKLNKNSATVNVGSSVSLKATLTPSNATDKTIKWSSSDTSVATVDSSGKVITKKSGTAVITAASSKSSVKATCKITVIVPVTGIKLNKATAEMYVGDKLTLTSSVLPSNASNKAVSWSTSDKSVAAVDKNGVITAVSTGTVTITCKTASGGKTAACTITVFKAVESVSLNITSKTINTGRAFTLKATVLPSDAADKEVKYSSSNTAVATVSAKGVVTAVGPGSAVITVKTVNKGKTAKCTLTVIQPVTAIKLNYAKYSTTQTLSFKLTAKIYPENATNKALHWSSDNRDILTVSESGKVKAVGVGKANIICTDSTGKIKVVCAVTVGNPIAKKIELNKTKLSLAVGDNYNLTGKVYPLVCPQNIIFFTDDDDIVYVTAEGAIVAKKKGKAVVCAKSSDGHAVASCIITVS